MSLRLLSALVLCTVWFAACESRRAEPSARNVVLIVADTLRADRLGCYGYARPTSPTIDALAARGTLFERSHSQGCWTVPSMISMISGLYVTKDENALPAAPSLFESLHAAGLETAAFVANEVLVKERGFERGVDRFVDLSNRSALDVADAFSGWLDARKGDRRFCAWVHFIDPHQPYSPAPEFDVFHGSPRPDFAELLPRWEKLQEQVPAYDPSGKALAFDAAVAEMERDDALYDGEVRQVDEGVKRVLAALEAHGRTGDTLIVFASDHGEMLFEQPNAPILIKDKLDKTHALDHGVKDLCANGHRPWYYEDLWNTPFVLAGPSVPAGVRRKELAQNLDLYPTILEALDIAAPEHLQGRSVFRARSEPLLRVHAYGHQTSAVLDDAGRKLVVYPRQWYLLPGPGPAPVLYFDLRSDSSETLDRSAEFPAAAQELREAIDRWHATNERAADTTLTPEQERILRQNGYLDTGK
jgi:arylsulfatase A-like enzyme